VREAATICPAPCKLTFDLLTLKVVSESRVTWATYMPMLVLGLSVLDLGPMYLTDRRQTDVRRASSLNAPYLRGGGIIRLMTDLQLQALTFTYSHCRVDVRKSFFAVKVVKPWNCLPPVPDYTILVVCYALPLTGGAY